MKQRHIHYICDIPVFDFLSFHIFIILEQSNDQEKKMFVNNFIVS